MRSYVYKTVPSIHLFPAISGRGEVEKEERRSREWHNTFGIEIIGEHKEQTKQLGERRSIFEAHVLLFYRTRQCLYHLVRFI